jgi:phosphoenolpyruvate synthase/pyruvate phosphate dikinase
MKRSLGEKKSKIILSGTATTEVELSENDSRNFSVNEENLVKLGIIAIRVEKALGNLKPIDIEWAALEVKIGRIKVFMNRTPIRRVN